MEGETRAVSEKSGLIKAQPISVLVVDDDTTCLAIVAAKLKKFHNRVVTVKHPDEALCTLRIKGDTFDLVVTDVHMPNMTGIQLQQVIAREFHLPVVLMSADKKEDVVLEGLESGAAFYISKPVSANDLKDLWQFAITKKKTSRVEIEEIECSTHEIISSSNKTGSSGEVGANASMNGIAGSTSSVNEVKRNHDKEPKRKYQRREVSSGKTSETASQKKTKVVWTNSLHNRFLEAIGSIGVERAVPKKILEVMNVPSLTRENVASHLQKYRIFLRRVTEEANLKLMYSDKRRAFEPMFTPYSRSSPSSLFLNSLTRRYNPTPKPFVGAKSAFILNRESSSSDILGQSGYGQSRLLSNGGGMVIPNVARTYRAIDNENSSHSTHQSFSTRLAQTIYQNITSDQGNFSGALSSYFDPKIFDSVQGNIYGTRSPHFDPKISGSVQGNISAPHFDPKISGSVQGNMYGTRSPNFDSLGLNSTSGVNLQTANYGAFSSCINNGTISPNFNPLSSTTSKDSATRTNYVGLNISRVQNLLVKSAGKQPACYGSQNNLASEPEFQNSTAMGTGLGSNESQAIDVDEMAGDLLWDETLAARSQMMMQSTVFKVPGNAAENGLGGNTYDHSAAYSYSPMFDLDELTNLPMDEDCNLNPIIPTSTNQVVNVQHQVQAYSNVPPFGQAFNEASNNPIVNVQNQVQNYDTVSPFGQVLNQRGDDDLLESLLGQYGENNIGGNIA